MKFTIVGLFFSIISLGLFGQGESFVSLSKVTPEGGVVYSQVTSILEDSQGFIWFGTNNGLFSYNTIDIKRYSYFQRDSTSLSTNRINRLFKDNNGKLWVATESGLCSYNNKRDNFERLVITDQFDNFIGKNVISFFQDAQHTYWFSDEKGIASFDPKLKRAFYQNVNNKTTLITFSTIDKDGTIWVFYEDGDIYFLTKGSQTFQFFKKGLSHTISSVLFNDGLIYIGYRSAGLLCIDVKDGTIVNSCTSYTASGDLKLPSEQIRSLVKDDNDKIWVATNNGIAILNGSQEAQLVNKQKYPELPHQSIWSLYKDSNHNIWIGTWLGGLAFHSKHNNSFHHFTQSSSSNSLSSNIVSCFAQIPNQKEILIGTDDGELNRYNPETNMFSTISLVYDGELIKRIKSVTYDAYGTLWVGTYRNGVFFRKNNQKSFQKLIPPFETGFQNLNLLATKAGLWVSNYPNGVYYYNFKSKSFTSYTHNPLDINTISDNNIRHIIQDKNENIWFATENGLNVLKKNSTKFLRVFHQNHNPRSISDNYIYHIHEDSKGFLWLGTNGEGLDKFDPDTGIAEHFAMKDGLAGNEIFSILEDNENDLWLTTENGLCKFNPRLKRAQSFVSNKGIKNNHFYPVAALQTANGELYFGGSNGLIRFQSKAISTNPIPPITRVTELLIHNERIIPETDNGILQDVIGNTEAIKLDHRQNTISFQFTSNSYINPQVNKFDYRLKNFDDKWIESNYNGLATFTNVPPGEYVFEVKGSNNYGIWKEEPTQIFIAISAPIWRTWYAYLFYSLLFAASVYFFRKQVINRQKLKMSVKMGKIQRETEEQLHQMKLQFFTNISHEFRTPLTLIQGPVNRLLKGGVDHESRNKQLSLIRNNTDRLLRLINQFLDFRRADHGKLKLNPINADIVSFCKNVFDCFEEHADQRDFSFQFISDFSSLQIDFDTDKLDKVLVNLLSNAFKYSPDNGSIQLRILSNTKLPKEMSFNSYMVGDPVEGDFVEISIVDSGNGIPKEMLPKIFERFFQIDNDYTSGTGIGLALSTNYIRLHSGQLTVNTLEGKGCTLSICIPQHQPEVFNRGKQEVLNPNIFDFTSEPITGLGINGRVDETINNQESLVLIVEDNPELLDFLGDTLQNHFRVAKCKNGKKAYELSLSLYPDIVISDIMLPGMDGIALCKKIKNDIRTSHIPVILLTALDTIKDKITGIHSGADAYIAKPFNEDFLVTRIHNLLDSRKKLRSVFALKQEVWDQSIDEMDLDKKLLQKAINVIEKNMMNADFTVENLANRLNLSRTHLHRKLKSLTNQSATEFIRSIRLKQAISLMRSGNYKINEIGYAVGFNSHNYFTKTFKKQYGKSPSEFIKENYSNV